MRLTWLFVILFILRSEFVFSQSKFSASNSVLYFLNENIGMVVRTDSSIKVTYDGGESWIIRQFDSQIICFAFTKSGKGWAASMSNLYFTSDTCRSWSKSTIDNSTPFFTVHFLNDSAGFVGSYNKILRTSDNGNSWTNAYIDSPYNVSITNFSFLNDVEGIATSGSTLFKTTDGGYIWLKLPIDLHSSYSSFYRSSYLSSDFLLLSGYHIYIVAEGFLLKSTNGGTSWSPYGNGQYFKFGITDQHFASQLRGLVTSNGLIYSTLNSGNTWDTINVSVYRFHFLDENSAWGISETKTLKTTDSWKTFKVIDSISTKVEESNYRLNSFQLFQNYPNPFGEAIHSGNPHTIISFRLSAISRISLKVFDILGREIVTLVDEELDGGVHNYPFSIFNLARQQTGFQLASGVYFYQLKSGDFVTTKKMVLLN
ncbi:MAG: T9SS type A sorting domain-containing protein [Ignavibacteria bacterium]|nr:T9SS type A sorting domain-containing protein [Ignavibacteria bacterium]